MQSCNRAPCYTIYMQRLCAALLFGFVLCIPFGYAKPAAADINIKNNYPLAASQVSVIEAPEVGLVHVSELTMAPHAACVVGTAETAPLVQQTVDVEALLVCDTVVFGFVPAVGALSVTGNPLQSMDLAVLPPVEASVGPALAPWSSTAQSVALVAPPSTAGFRNVFMVKTEVALDTTVIISQMDRDSKTLAQLGFMLC